MTTQKRRPRKIALKKKSLRRIDSVQLNRVAGADSAGVLCGVDGNGEDDREDPTAYTDCNCGTVKPFTGHAGNHNQHLAVRR